MSVVAVPVVRVDEVFHVGTLNAALRGACGDSQEAACLSVSLCPQAWTEIARLGGRPTWRLTRRAGVFLDIHRAMEDQTLLSKVLDWANKQGLFQSAQRFRSYRWDSDSGGWRYMLCDTHEEALNEIDESECWEMDGPDGGALVREVTIKRGTAALGAMVGASAMQLDECDDLLLMAWAMKVASGLDGVWWTENYDPQGLSAPRGGLLPEKVALWKAAEAGTDADDDDELMDLADYEAVLLVSETESSPQVSAERV